MDIDYTKLSEKEITLTADEVNCLGPRLVLENCIIRSACDHDTLKIVGLEMIGGSFVQHKRLTHFQFDAAQFISRANRKARNPSATAPLWRPVRHPNPKTSLAAKAHISSAWEVECGRSR